MKNTGDYDVEVTFNELGLRDARSLKASTPDSIVVVGDSFAFGWGVEERQRFSNLLQERLARPVFNVSAGSADLEGMRSSGSLCRREWSHHRHADRQRVWKTICEDTKTSRSTRRRPHRSAV